MIKFYNHILLLFLFILSMTLPLQQSQSNSTKDLSMAVHNYLEQFRKQLHKNSALAYKYLDSAKVSARSTNVDSLKFKVYRSFIDYYLMQQDYLQLINNIDSALVYRASVPAKEHLRIYLRLATASYFLQDYQTAKDAYTTVINICETHNFFAQLPIAYNGLSNVYLEIADLENAEKTVLKAIEQADLHGTDAVKMNSNMQYGNVLLRKKDYKGALENYNKVHHYATTNNNVILLHEVNTHLSDLFKLKKQFNQALFYTQQNLVLNKNMNNQIGIINSNQDIAVLHAELQQYKKAINVLKGNIALTDKTGNTFLQRANYLLLSELYEKNSNPTLALISRKQYETLNDSILNIEYLKNLNDLELKYETEKNRTKF